MGRPRMDMSDEQVAQIEKMAAVLTQEQIAHFLDISPRTLRNRITDDERVFAAYYKGRANAVANVGTALLRDALNGNTTAQIFYLKTQAGWRDRLELSGPDGGPIQTEDVHAARERIGNRIAGIASRVGANGDNREPNTNGTGGA